MELEINDLVGRTVKSVKIIAQDIVILETDKGNLYLSWSADCCAQCYLQHVSGSEALVGHTILEAYNSEWTIVSGIEEYGDNLIESMGTSIKTTGGYVTFESRLDHNGYYSGHIKVDDESPIDQYGDRIDISKYEMKELVDF